jgi:hypothetical protein
MSAVQRRVARVSDRYLRIVITPFNRTLRQSPIEREPRDDGNARYPQPNGTSQASVILNNIVPFLFLAAIIGRCKGRRFAGI